MTKLGWITFKSWARCAAHSIFLHHYIILHHITDITSTFPKMTHQSVHLPNFFREKKKQQFVGFSPLTSPSLIKSTSRCPKVRNPWSSVQIRGGPYHPPWKLKKGQARISSPHLCGHRNPAEVEIPAPQSTTMF